MLKRRRLGLLMTLCLSLTLFAGCSSSGLDDYATNVGYTTDGTTASEDGDETAASTEASTGSTSTAETLSASDIKVGVLYISDPDEGSGYSYTHDLGIIGMQDNLGLSEDQIVRKIVDDSDEEGTREAILECIDAGCNIIFTTSWGYMEVTAEMAEEYPDVYFSHGTGYMSNGTNFNNYFGRIYQARYLSGIVAGLNTTTNKIGYVAAQDSSNSEVTGGIDAFALGVASVNPDATIYVVVTNSWYDEEAEEAAARTLLDMGCDVMSQHCDTPYPVTLAEEYGVYAIGYNSDMSKESPDACLCSVIWSWSAYYTYAVQCVMNGTFGDDYYGGLAEGLLDITSLASFVAEGTQEAVDEAYAAILSGTFNVFDGVIETNDGSTVGTDGGTLDDATITGGIDWYYKNVVIVE